MSEGLMRRRSRSPPAPEPLPDDDDMLGEILLRLPPVPSSLPRASLVCKRWCRLLSDPHFLRRFRAFHRRRQPPPLLGFFAGLGLPGFTSTLDPPDRVPSARLSLQAPRRDGRDICNFLGCRHGLVLILNRTRLEITVWDPVSGDQRRVPVPPGWFPNEDPSMAVRNGALLCYDGRPADRVPLETFKVMLLLHGWPVAEDSKVFVSLYETETSVWCDLISTSIEAPLSMINPSILVGNSLCWLFLGYGNGGILEFDLDRKNLAVIKHPVDAHFTEDTHFQILRLEDNRLGLAICSVETIQLWVRKADTGVVARWLLQKTIDLNKLLSMRSPVERSWHVILGYDEDNHVIFISRAHQVFMIQLKSMQFRNLFESNIITAYHPYTSFYVVGNSSCLLVIKE